MMLTYALKEIIKIHMTGCSNSNPEPCQQCTEALVLVAYQHGQSDALRDAADKANELSESRGVRVGEASTVTSAELRAMADLARCGAHSRER